MNIMIKISYHVIIYKASISCNKKCYMKCNVFSRPYDWALTIYLIALKEKLQLVGS